MARFSFGRVLGLACLVVYAWALHEVYLEVISPKFAYNGQVYQEPNLVYYAISVLLLSLAWLTGPYRLRSGSDFVLWVFFYLVVASVALVPHFAQGVDASTALLLSSVACVSYVVICRVAATWSPDLFPNWTGLSPRVFVWLLMAASLLSLVYLGLSGNLSFSVASLFETRETRFEYRDVVSEGSGLLGYLVRFQGYVLGPALLAFAFQRNNWVGVALAVIGQVAIYSLTAYKIVFLSVPVIIILLVLFRRGRGVSFAVVGFAMTVILVVGTSVDRILDQPIVSEIFINRLLVIPGFLTGVHVWLFTDAPKYLWSDSVLSSFVSAPYPTSSAFLVGHALTGGMETTANANIYASGFANAGWVGIVVELLVFALLLFAVKACTQRVDRAAVYSTLLLPAVALANSGIFAAFLTNGFAYALILLLLAPRSRSDPQNEQGGPRVSTS
ncbi:hypothetical protein [Citricoccus sp. GCM10030269]|uniref:hypothetical protein n=1 Tax=Citricoccus sp. GCM10030269 TaxID=3273388 RepID=UPI00360C5783